MALSVAFAAACSGGEDDSLTHGVFVERVDRLCRQANEAADPYLRQLVVAVSHEDYPSAADELEKAVDVSAPFYERMAALDAPSENERDFERFLELNRQFEERAARAIEGLRKKGAEGLSEFADPEPAETTHRVASRLGLSDCSDADPTQ